MSQVLFVLLGFLLLSALLVQRGHWLVIVFVAVWLFFPNASGYLIGFNGYPLFIFLEPLLAAALLLRIYLDPEKSPAGRRERILLYWMWAAFITQYSLGMVFIDAVYPVEADEFWRRRLTGFSHGFAAVAFFHACIHYVRTEDHVRDILKVFYWAGIILSLELFAVLLIPPVKAVLAPLTLNFGSGFRSVFLNAHHLVSTVSAIAVLTGYYFWRMTRQRRFIFGSVVAILPLLYNFGSRAQLLGFAVAFSFALWFRLSTGKRILMMGLVTVTAIAALFILPLILGDIVTFAISASSGLENRQYMLLEVFESDSLSHRMGLWIRGLEVLKTLLPFGTGEETYGYYAAHYAIQGQAIFSNPITAEGYQSATLRWRELHNGYIDFFISYGLIGLAAAVIAVYSLVQNWQRRHILAASNQSMDLFLLVYSILVFFAVFFSFQSYPHIYVIYFLAVHASFLLLENVDTGIVPGIKR